MRRAVLLDQPAPNLATALDHLGYVQIDPINVCGRMHDLILRHRVTGYREGDLMRHLHGRDAVLPAEARIAFEHHLPTLHTLVALTPDAWPHLLAEMRQRTRRHGAWSGRLSPKQRLLSGRILAEIAARGPMCSEDFAGSGRARAVWGSATQAKATLQKMFFHGRLLIARRGGDHRRYYDLPERVLPAAILRLPESTPDEAARWETVLKLRQRRLVLLTKSELSRVGDLVLSVQVENCPTLHCLRTDLPLLEACQAGAGGDPSPALLLLAPLDPLIYDRRLTHALWNFDYTWEAYTPPAKRKRGYYAQPVLAGIELVGHVDAKADRERNKLVVIARRIRSRHRTAPAVTVLAQFLGLR
ncbi:MAG TPA: crosslink repair DNA glycosylase YcaQ family protein [Lacunisphaera sp.]|jgi:uncharacterized protein YcaQ|nr:crosslink repair DNA glycosylase YcaQ family protein [Lacunisphaera sp.]